MPWFKVDDKIHSHPKARRAGLAAMGLWGLAGSHCMDYLTDGVVERWFVESWPKGVKLAGELVAVGLWDEHPDGWQFHDWDDYQPTRDKVLTERAATKERVERWRAEHRNATGNGVTNGVGTTAPSPSPSPDLTKTSKSQSSNNRARDSTDAEAIPEMTRLLAGQAGITNLPRIIQLAHEQLDRTLTPDDAYRLSLRILGKAKQYPKAAQRYVQSCFTKSPAEIQKLIDEGI